MSEQKPSLRQRLRRRIRRNLPYLMVVVLMLMVLLVYFYDRVLVTVHSGQAGVKYLRFMGGTVTDRPYHEGFYLIFPWDRMYIYNVRNQVISHDFQALSRRGLPIDIELTIRFRPEYELVGLLHQQVGPDYVARIVKPEVESTIRAIIGKYDADEVYTTERSVIERIVNESLEQSAQRYVIIDDVLITRVMLPAEVRKAIELKLVEEQKAQAYEFILAREVKEAERKRIEAGGIEDYQAIISQSLTEQILTEKGIRATRELATSENAKVVVVGGGNLGLPLILGGETGRVINGETPPKR